MRILRITKHACKTIGKECKKYDTETGGELVGTLNIPVVVEATEAGPCAQQSYGSYTNDELYDNQRLKQIIKHSNGKFKLVGFWHKHPGSMSKPSSVDLATARKIVNRFEKTDNRPVFFIIANIIDNKVELHGYSMRQDQKDIEKVMIRVLNNKSKEIAKAIKQEPVIVQPKEMDFWKDTDFQFYLTETGYERLKREVDELTVGGYCVKAYAKDKLHLIIKKRNILICMPPPEYPLNPPRFFQGKNEIMYSMPIWNSSFRIIDILDNIRKYKKIRRRDNESVYYEKMLGLSGLFKKIRRAVKFIRLHKKE